MEGARKFLLNNLSYTQVEVEGGGGGGGGGGLKDDALHFLKYKLGELLHLLNSLYVAFVSKVDQIFPPETRSGTFTRWAHVALTVALPVALVALFLYCCCKCCRRCCCGRGGYGRMMRAPGRGGSIMPRSVFEASPRDYFINLRANKPLVF